MDREKISIIVPIYNKSDTVRCCLESLLKQSYKNIEIILVDDGSTDDTYEICDSFAKKDDRVRLLKNKHGGVSNARNFGLQVATGEYIQFVDADDFLCEDMCLKLITAVKDSKSDVVVCSYKKHARKITIEKSCPNFQCDNIVAFREKFAFLFENALFNPPWNKLYRKDKIATYFPENFSIGEDLLFNLAYFSQCSQIKIISDCLYNYVDKSSQSLNKLYYDDLVDRQVFLYKEVKRFCEFNFNDPSLGGIIDRVFLKEIYYALKKVVFKEDLRNKEKILKIKKIISTKEIKDIPKNLKINDAQIKILNFLIKNQLKYCLLIFFYLKKLLFKSL